MKRTLGYVLVAGFMFGTLFAQDAPKTEAAKKDGPPVVSGEIRASYWKAVHQLDLAQAAGVQAQAQVQAAVNEGIKVCGEKYVLGIDPEKQDLTCIVKPVAKAEPAKK